MNNRLESKDSCGRQQSIQDYTQNIIIVSGQQPTSSLRRPPKNIQQEDGFNLLVLQQTCFENYHTFAYTLIIGSYFIAFCLYLYLRLLSWIFSQKIIYKRHCQKHENETIVRMELHYVSATATFLVMAIYQLVCFFFLTISSKWMEVRRSFNNFISMEERLRNELVFGLKRVMFVTVLPTLLVYLLSAIVVTLTIFYMVGMRDSVNHIGSQVIICFFDGCMCVYFAAFPLISVIYHPDIKFFARCSAKKEVQSAPRKPCANPATALDSQKLKASTLRQQPKAEVSRLQSLQEAVTAGAFVSQQQSCSSSSMASGRSIQQWAKQLPLNPTNLQHHPRIRVDNDSYTSKYRRLSNEIRKTTTIPPIERTPDLSVVDKVVETRRRSSVNKKG